VSAKTIKKYDSEGNWFWVLREQPKQENLMAKSAKHIDTEITERVANKFVKDILEHFDNIESARGKFMNTARRERDAMVVIYEYMAARGVSQKSAKTEIKIVRALERIKGWLADLEAEDRKMVQKLAKAQGDKRQLLLFAELPPIPKQTKAELRAAAEADRPKLELVEGANA
jgi:hypothetical protein